MGKKVLRQGGVTAPDDTFDVDATWEWNGQTWTQIADGFIRGGHSLLFDAARGKMLAFGGGSTCDKSPSRGRWEFDGTHWNLITAKGPPARSTFNRIFVWGRAPRCRRSAGWNRRCEHLVRGHLGVGRCPVDASERSGSWPSRDACHGLRCQATQGSALWLLP